MKTPTRSGWIQLCSVGIILGLLQCTPVEEPNPSGSNNQTGNTPPASNPNPGSNPPSGTNATTTAPSTMFAVSQCYTLNTRSYVYQKFTISAQTRFFFRVAAAYNVAAAVIPESEFANFKAFTAFRGYGIFLGKFGTNEVTLSAGTYYVAVRNEANVSQKVSFELDYAVSLPTSDRCELKDYYATGALLVNANGGKVWQPFTIQSGFRYFLDGVNSGDLQTWIIPASQIDNFKSNQSFQQYSDYEGDGCDAPGLYEIKLNPGDYYFIANNKSSASSAIVYTLERWRKL